ncbi:MAG: ribosome-binding factor A [Patescibacteria group bacterium]
MNNIKHEKLRTILKDLAASFLQMETNRTTLITVTDCKLADNEKSAKIFLSVLPADAEEGALSFAKRKRPEFRAYVRSRVRLKHIPMFDFLIDAGEKKRQRIDELLRE